MDSETPDRPALTGIATAEAETEIEVTPLMTEAGAVLLAGFSPREDLPEERAEQVYRAMELVRRRVG